jgi:hypothetical protein
LDHDACLSEEEVLAGALTIDRQGLAVFVDGDHSKVSRIANLRLVLSMVLAITSIVIVIELRPICSIRAAGF